MKKLTLLATCFVTFAACKKESASSKTPEDKGQLLTRVLLSSSAGNLSYEVANYRYNSAGKIIAEGNRTYQRDEQQRIVRILDPSTLTNRTDIKVYYDKASPAQVDYTLYILADGARDSVVYVHDDAGQLTKTVSYYSESAEDVLPKEPVLSNSEVFQYDESGNIIQIDFYNNNKGSVSHCGQYRFSGYYNSINPQYAEDEVRTPELSCSGILNASRNNFANFNTYTKVYELRADGRPRNCRVFQNGSAAYTLSFEYE